MITKVISGEEVTFSTADFSCYQSDYLHGGRQNESWIIEKGCILGDSLNAIIAIANPYLSQTDQDRFHLSIFPAQEFCSELLLYWMHKKLSLECKTQEAWMSKCSCNIRRAIRCHQNIQVSMTCNSFRQINRMAYARSSFKISDDIGGLFIIEQQGGFRY